MIRGFVRPALGPMLMVLLTAGSGAHARSPHQELIGVPVFAADGAAVGHVADVSTTSNNEIDAIRIRTGAALGFGERLVVIPQPAFMIRRGVVLLPDLSAEDVEAFPDASTTHDEFASEDR